MTNGIESDEAQLDPKVSQLDALRRYTLDVKQLGIVDGLVVGTGGNIWNIFSEPFESIDQARDDSRYEDLNIRAYELEKEMGDIKLHIAHIKPGDVKELRRRCLKEKSATSIITFKEQKETPIKTLPAHAEEIPEEFTFQLADAGIEDPLRTFLTEVGETGGIRAIGLALVSDEPAGAPTSLEIYHFGDDDWKFHQDELPKDIVDAKREEYLALMRIESAMNEKLRTDKDHHVPTQGWFMNIQGLTPEQAYQRFQVDLREADEFGFSDERTDEQIHLVTFAVIAGR